MLGSASCRNRQSFNGKPAEEYGFIDGFNMCVCRTEVEGQLPLALCIACPFWFALARSGLRSRVPHVLNDFPNQQWQGSSRR